MGVDCIKNIIPRLKTEVKDYLNKLIDDGTFLEPQQLYQSYNYPDEINLKKGWAHFGNFYDYLIRREIGCMLRKSVIMDDQAEKCKAAFERFKKLEAEIAECCASKGERGNQLEEYHYTHRIKCNIRIKNTDKAKLETFLKSYETFKDPNFPTLDILEDIFNTSMLYLFSYGNYTFDFQPEFINKHSIKDILDFVRTLNLRNILINPYVKGKFFDDDADLVFEDSIMELKTSCKVYNTYKQDEDYRNVIYQMIFFALGLFNEYDEERKTFKIYNPLLGILYSLNLPNLDFKELSQKIDNEPPYESGVCSNADT